MTAPLPPDASPPSPPPESAGLGALILIPVLIVLVAGGAFSVFGYFAWSDRKSEGPVAAETERMTVLQGAIRAYREERGAYPPGPSSALVRALATPSKGGKPFLVIPAHALSASGELLDGWGSPVYYQDVADPSVPGGQRFEMYSFGPNMKDEKGAGDDVLAGE